MRYRVYVNGGWYQNVQTAKDGQRVATRVVLANPYARARVETMTGQIVFAVVGEKLR